ncbi:MAG: nucleotidyltransferase family protein [Cyanophyceae cyanobacterium]
MSPLETLTTKQNRLAEFCQKWQIVQLACFGSVLRDDFRPDSDIDLLVDFAPRANLGLLDFIRLENELSALLGRPVDLVEKSAVETSPNWIRRTEILNTAQVIYAT